MIARRYLIAVATILACFASNVLQAEEPGVVMTESRGGLIVRFEPRSRRVAPAATAGSATRKSISSTVASEIVTTKLTTSTAFPKQDQQPPPLAPAPQPAQPAPSAPAASSQLSASVFGSGTVQSSQLAQERRSRASATSSDIVLGRESGFRATSDAGSLLGKSNQTRGVATQKRTPIITDTRVRGAGVGSLVVGG